LERWARREKPAAGLARTAQRAVPTQKPAAGRDIALRCPPSWCDIGTVRAAGETCRWARADGAARRCYQEREKRSPLLGKIEPLDGRRGGELPKTKNLNIKKLIKVIV